MVIPTMTGDVALSGLGLARAGTRPDRLRRERGHRLGGAAAAVPATSGPTTAAVVHASITGTVNILLAGIDERPTDPSYGARSDSILIAHVPATHDRAYLISIPRDSRVQIP